MPKFLENLILRIKINSANSKLHDMCLNIKDLNLLRTFVQRIRDVYHPDLKSELFNVNENLKWLKANMEKIK